MTKLDMSSIFQVNSLNLIAQYITKCQLSSSCVFGSLQGVLSILMQKRINKAVPVLSEFIP